MHPAYRLTACLPAPPNAHPPYKQEAVGGAGGAAAAAAAGEDVELEGLPGRRGRGGERTNVRVQDIVGSIHADR